METREVFSSLPPSFQPHLSEAEFKLIQALVYEQCGMHFDERRSHFLEDRLLRRLKACQLSSYYSYYQLLTSAEGKDELAVLLETLTINETSFFRNKAQLDLFHREIVEEMPSQAGAAGLDITDMECRVLARPGSLHIGHADLRRACLLLPAQSVAV